MLVAPHRGRGRPSSMTAEARTRFLEALRAGNTIQDSAEFAGRDYSTIRRWFLRGCKPNARTDYREFAEDVKQASTHARVVRVTRIAAAGARGVWQADAWWLERMFPETWGRRTVEVSGPDGGPIDTLNRFEIDLRLPPAERKILP